MRRPDKMKKRKKASALLLGSYLAIILAPTVAIIIVYMMMQRALLDIQKEKTQNLTNEAAITFNQEVEQLISITQYITYGEELKRYMEAREAWDPSQDYYQAYKLAESYPDYALINRFVRNIYILPLEASYLIQIPRVIPSNKWGMVQLDLMKDDENYEEVAESLYRQGWSQLYAEGRGKQKISGYTTF